MSTGLCSFPEFGILFPWYNSVPCSFGTEVSAFSSAVRWGLLPAPRGPCSSWSCSPFYRPFQVAGHFFKASERISPSSQLRLSLKTMGYNPRSDCSIIFAIYCMLMKGASIPPNTQRGLFSMCTPRAGISGGRLSVLPTTELFWSLSLSGSPSNQQLFEQ